jgi:Leucine-rich repeat (LRR) protein
LKWISLQASNIQKLPNDLVNYSHLHALDLARCQYLEQPPNFIGSKLVQLQEFNLFGCSKLESLFNGIGGMLTLQHLSMKDCVKVQKILTSIGEMSNLHKFDLLGCLNV